MVMKEENLCAQNVIVTILLKLETITRDYYFQAERNQRHTINVKIVLISGLKIGNYKE